MEKAGVFARTVATARALLEAGEHNPGQTGGRAISSAQTLPSRRPVHTIRTHRRLPLGLQTAKTVALMPALMHALNRDRVIVCDNSSSCCHSESAWPPIFHCPHWTLAGVQWGQWVAHLELAIFLEFGLYGAIEYLSVLIMPIKCANRHDAFSRPLSNRNITSFFKLAPLSHWFT